MERTTEERSAFFKRMNNNIAIYYRTIDLLNSCIPLLSKFDGKMLNKRVCDAIKEIIPPQANLFLESDSSKESVSRFTVTTDGKQILICHYSNTPGSYVKTYFNVVTDDKKKINYSETVVAIQKRIDDLSEQITKSNLSKELYDQEVEDWNKLTQSIQEYHAKYRKHYELKGHVEFRRDTYYR